MELNPSERSVLSQIQVLYESASRREHQYKSLSMQWSALHYAAHQGGYMGLLAKRLIQNSTDAQAFRITDAGLRAMGITLPAVTPPIESGRIVAPKGVSRSAPKGAGEVKVSRADTRRTTLRLVASLAGSAALIGLAILAWRLL